MPDFGNILILDDEKTNIDIIKNAIRQDHNIYYALKPKDALEIMKRVRVDLMLLDIVMPEMDGYELCRVMKKDDAFKNIPIIFITGKNDIESVVKGFAEGAVDYIAKPFEISELTARVRTHMELQRTRRQLEMTNSELVKLNATRDRLFSIIGHDLRGSIGGIDSTLQFIMESSDLKESDVRDLVKELKDPAWFAYNLLENLLEWGRSQDKDYKITYQCFDLKPLAAECFEGMKTLAAKKSIRVINTVGSVLVEANKNMIATVMRNLLSNALKFTEAGGEISVAASEEEGLARVTVADNGVGIPGEKLKAIFNTGKYNSTPGTAGEKGTGLGLSLCRELIEMHKGSIWVESAEGKGSRFIFEVPRIRKA